MRRWSRPFQLRWHPPQKTEEASNRIDEMKGVNKETRKCATHGQKFLVFRKIFPVFRDDVNPLRLELVCKFETIFRVQEVRPTISAALLSDAMKLLKICVDEQRQVVQRKNQGAGVWGDACRQLEHLKGEKSWLDIVGPDHNMYTGIVTPTTNNKRGYYHLVSVGRNYS